MVSRPSLAIRILVTLALLGWSAGAAVAQTTTDTATPTPSPTATITPSPTITPIPSPTATVPPLGTPTATPSPTATATATPTPSPTATATPTPSPTATPVPTPKPTPTITIQQAIQQAAAQIPEPPIVHDLSDPGIVFGQLTEGVAAWIATLEGSRDKWGNLQTDVYVSADRPEFVPASLQTFLLQYYKDNSKIGLAFGPEGVAEAVTRLATARNDLINKTAQGLYDNAVKDANALSNNYANNAANNATNNSENVPPLNNNDNGNNNNNNNATGPVQLTSTNPPSFAVTSAGQTLTVNGTGFSATAAENVVNFSNGTEGLTPDTATVSMLSVKIPKTFKAGSDIQITVSVNGQTSNALKITAKPTLDRFVPATAHPGEVVQIYGFGFDTGSVTNNTIRLQGSREYMFNPTSCSIDGGSQAPYMSATLTGVETSATPYDVTVSTNGETTEKLTLTVSPVVP